MKININKKSVTLEFNSQKEKEKFIDSDLFKKLVSFKETLEIDKIEELSELEKAIRKAIEQFDWDKYWLKHPIKSHFMMIKLYIGQSLHNIQIHLQLSSHKEMVHILNGHQNIHAKLHLLGIN